MTPESDLQIVLRRPHFRLEGSSLYFLASTRPHCALDPLAAEIWLALAQPASLQDLRERFGAHVPALLETFRKDGLCEFADAEFPAGRRRVLVVEPHADDAALSIGGLLWKRRYECEFTIATLASRSNFTSYYYAVRDFFDIDRVMEIRQAESELFARMIGGHSVGVGLDDAVLRYRSGNWSTEFYGRHRASISAVTARRAGRREVERWTQAVRTLIAETSAQELWFPQGSPHADHELTANACLAAVVSDPSLVAGKVVKLYQDVPYASRNPDYSRRMSAELSAAGFELEPEPVDIGDEFEQKLRLVSLYASQFKMQAMRTDIEASAALPEAGLPHAEMLWTVRRVPERLGASAMCPRSPDELLQEQAASAWLGRHAKARRARILLLVPTGRWEADRKVLAEALPEADWEIMVAPACAAEVLDAPSVGARVHQVEAGPWAWSLLALRIAAAAPMPTLFHCGPRRLREARWMSRLWPLSDTLVVDSMDRLISAWEHGATNGVGAAGEKAHA